MTHRIDDRAGMTIRGRIGNTMDISMEGKETTNHPQAGKKGGEEVVLMREGTAIMIQAV